MCSAEWSTRFWDKSDTVENFISVSMLDHMKYRTNYQTRIDFDYSKLKFNLRTYQFKYSTNGAIQEIETTLCVY